MKEAAETFKKAQKTKDITQIAEADVHFHDIDQYSQRESEADPAFE